MKPFILVLFAVIYLSSMCSHNSFCKEIFKYQQCALDEDSKADICVQPKMDNIYEVLSLYTITCQFQILKWAIFLYLICCVIIQCKNSTHYSSFSFKELLCTVTETKESCIYFMQANGVLVNSITCPGALVSGQRQGGCNNQMVLKKMGDSKDGLVWCCRKLHKIHKDDHTYS